MPAPGSYTTDDLEFFFYGGGSDAEYQFLLDCYAQGVTAADLLALIGGGGGGGAVRVEDEGTQIIAAASGLNFAGAGVAVSDAGSGEALVTIPGAGGGGVTDGDKGDINVSGAGSIWTVRNGTITAAKVAADIATQAELDAEKTVSRNADNLTSGTVADARLPAGITRDTELAAEATLARNADNLTSGTVADARLPAGIARDTEVTAAVNAEAVLARNADNLTSGTVAEARIPATIARDADLDAINANLTAMIGTVDAEQNATQAALDSHVGNATTAHAATAIPVSPAINGATNADAAMRAISDSVTALPSVIDGPSPNNEVTWDAITSPGDLIALLHFIPRTLVYTSGGNISNTLTKTSTIAGGYTPPANVLAAIMYVEFEIWGTVTNNTGATADVTYRLEYAGTTLCTIQLALLPASSLARSYHFKAMVRSTSGSGGTLSGGIGLFTVSAPGALGAAADHLQTTVTLTSTLINFAAPGAFDWTVQYSVASASLGSACQAFTMHRMKAT